jgi:hypothetical protein
MVVVPRCAGQNFFKKKVDEFYLWCRKEESDSDVLALLRVPKPFRFIINAGNMQLSLII